MDRVDHDISPNQGRYCWQENRTADWLLLHCRAKGMGLELLGPHGDPQAFLLQWYMQFADLRLGGCQ